jgi:hypothetical protein
MTSPLNHVHAVFGAHGTDIHTIFGVNTICAPGRVYKHTNDQYRPTVGSWRLARPQRGQGAPSDRPRPVSSRKRAPNGSPRGRSLVGPIRGRRRCAQGMCAGALRPAGGGRRFACAPLMLAKAAAPSLAAGMRAQRPPVAATALGSAGGAAAAGHRGGVAAAVGPAETMRVGSGESGMAQT